MRKTLMCLRVGMPNARGVVEWFFFWGSVRIIVYNLNHRHIYCKSYHELNKLLMK
jgi:hypothetical protein